MLHTYIFECPAPFDDKPLIIESTSEYEALYQVERLLRDCGHGQLHPHLIKTNDPEITKAILGADANHEDFVNLSVPLSVYL